MQDHSTISEAILFTTQERGKNKSICPSEIARKLYPANWRAHMGDVVDVAIQLHQRGLVEIMQKGEVIQVDRIKGPIRIRIK